MTGLYIHVPFCVSKCPYCDFYSKIDRNDETLDAYTAAVCREFARYPAQPIDTVYFGGGTPSLLGGARLTRILEAAQAHFSLCDGTEITLEANPADNLRGTFATFAAAGGNRISLGMQSGQAHLLSALGRRHTPADVTRTVQDIAAAGIDNFSLDLMLALPHQTATDIERDVALCTAFGATHVSAYLLKIEPNTPFAKYDLALPDEDAAADMYLLACERLQAAGYRQYEISNFAVTGFESRHNGKYWDGDSYIGIGPAAHSFWDNRRFAYPRDLAAFINGVTPITEENTGIAVGSDAEYAMLRLRRTDGIDATAFRQKFGRDIPVLWRQNADKLPSTLVTQDAQGIRLTRAGFLLSNVLTARILNL